MKLIFLMYLQLIEGLLMMLRLILACHQLIFVFGMVFSDVLSQEFMIKLVIIEDKSTISTKESSAKKLRDEPIRVTSSYFLNLSVANAFDKETCNSIYWMLIRSPSIN